MENKNIKLSQQLGDPNPFSNQLKMLHHIDRLAEWKANNDTKPILMEINLTNICNQACRWCISMYSHVSNPAMSLEEKVIKKAHLAKQGCEAKGLEINRLKTFITETATYGLKAVTWSGGGEPTTYYRFAELVQHTVGKLEQGLMTNGQFSPKLIPIIGHHLKWIRVSLDTFDAEKYSYQRYSQRFNAVITNIKALTKYPVSIGLNMNIAEWNMNEIVEFAKKGRNLGVDYVQFRPILGLPFETKDNGHYRNQLGENILPTIKAALLQAQQLNTATFKVLVSWDKFNDIQDIEGNFGRNYTKCLGHNFVCVLNADGFVEVCMYRLGEEKFKMGNIYQQSFAEIWEGQQRAAVKAHCCNTIDFSKCTVCCKLHNLNKLLHSMQQDINEVNFI